MPHALVTLAFALVALTTPALSAAQQPRTAASAAAATTPPGNGAAPVTEGAPDSPRASVKHYLDLCRAGEYAEAAEYLDLSDTMKPEGAMLARRLKAVLDRQIWVKLEEISPAALGQDNDGLPPGVDEIGTVPGRTGPEPVRLVRRRGSDGTRWLFSRATVEHIPDWFGRLRDRWIQVYLPQALLRTGPQELMWWQWIALPLMFAGGLTVGKLLGYATRRLLGRITVRLGPPASMRWNENLFARLSSPLAFTWALLAVYFAYPALGLYEPAEAFMERMLRAGVFLSGFWFALRGIDVMIERALEAPLAQGYVGARSLLPLGTKFGKVIVCALAAIAVLSELGYPVTSLIAGLGIGGVALALAAQKTVENLFGSLSIGVDQPFRIGDLVVVDTVTGHVESIGLRSTRIRTLDRTIVTLPNGKLADMRIESFAERDRCRFLCVLGLGRETRAAAVREVLEGARRLLAEHPKVWPSPSVALVKVAESSLDIEVNAWFTTADWNEFLRLREEALLALLEIVEKAGAELAYPVRRVQVTGQGEALPTSW